jgi:hypothetical protein
MAKKVMFFGAGLSRAFGFPVTAHILPLIIKGIIDYNSEEETWLYKEDKKNQAFYITLLKLLIYKLSPGIEHVFENSPNEEELMTKEFPLVTDLLSQLDHLLTTGQDISDWNFSDEDTSEYPLKTIIDRIDLKALKTLFEWAIVATIGRKKLHKRKRGHK